MSKENAFAVFLRKQEELRAANPKNLENRLEQLANEYQKKSAPLKRPAIKKRAPAPKPAPAPPKPTPKPKTPPKVVVVASPIKQSTLPPYTVTQTFESSTAPFYGKLEDYVDIPLSSGITLIQGYSKAIGGLPVTEKSKTKTIHSDEDIKRVVIKLDQTIITLREDTITISGKIPLEEVLKKLPMFDDDDFKITNKSFLITFDKSIDISSMYDENSYWTMLQRGTPGGQLYYRARNLYNPTDAPLDWKRKTGNVSLETHEEYFKRLIARWPDKKTIAFIYQTGKIVVSGDVQKVLKYLQCFHNHFKNPLKKDESKYKDLVDSRYEQAGSWNNQKNGYYVRPGPNSKPRFYKVPNNPAYVRQKVLRAYEQVGVKVPTHVVTILGIQNVQVKPKVETKRVTNWNLEKPGYYIRPDPAGLPKFYKVPKDVSKGKSTVIAAYSRIGKNIPKAVRNIFGLVNNQEHKGPVQNLRIQPRIPTRNLKAVIETIGQPAENLKRKQLKKVFEQQFPAPNVSSGPNFRVANLNHFILPESRKVMRGGRSRVLNSFKVDEIQKMLRSYNISNTSGTKSAMINRMIMKKTAKPRSPSTLFKVAIPNITNYELNSALLNVTKGKEFNTIVRGIQKLRRKAKELR